MADYIKEIRALVGHKPILLNAAGGAVFNDQGQILIQQRTDNRTWSLPGGFMEYGETFRETVLREYKEDSGLEVKIDHLIGVFDQGFTVYPNGDECQVISALFAVTPIGGKRITEEQFETVGTDYFDEDNLPPLLNQQTADMIHAAFADWRKHHNTEEKASD
ncbi:NUDIX hydrolase [Schleiferilactobacillus harbinensis]|uniref:NUDIX hydrolase n=1 Tax=Schleiferilactobacillus harbinensis TaxID=304207 RepID=UPI0039EADFD7